MKMQLIAFSIISVVFSQDISFTPTEMQKYVIVGFIEEGINVECTIKPAAEDGKYDYFVTHISGFNNNQDFLFAAMGTVAMNSNVAGFDSEWLIMNYNDSKWRINIEICQESFEKVMNSDNIEDEENIIEYLKQNIEKLD